MHLILMEENDSAILDDLSTEDVKCHQISNFGRKFATWFAKTKLKISTSEQPDQLPRCSQQLNYLITKAFMPKCIVAWRLNTKWLEMLQANFFQNKAQNFDDDNAMRSCENLMPKRTMILQHNKLLK